MGTVFRATARSRVRLRSRRIARTIWASRFYIYFGISIVVFFLTSFFRLFKVSSRFRTRRFWSLGSLCVVTWRRFFLEGKFSVRFCVFVFVFRGYYLGLGFSVFY